MQPPETPPLGAMGLSQSRHCAAPKEGFPETALRAIEIVEIDQTISRQQDRDGQRRARSAQHPMSSAPPPSTSIEQLLAHAEWLQRLSVHVVRGEDAADLVQDTWVAALRSPPDRTRSARPWLAEVLRNFARRRARDQEARDRREGLTAMDAVAVPSPEELLDQAEAQRILAELVVALPEPYRTTVLLRYYEGLASTAIASAAGLPEGTVRWRLKEGLRRLRLGLDERHRSRKVWSGALLPLATGSPPHVLQKRTLMMASKSKLAVASLVFALGVLSASGWLVWRAAREPQKGDRSERALFTSRAGRSRQVIEAWQYARGTRDTVGVISGVVLDSDGKPVAGARIALILECQYQDMADRVALRPAMEAASSREGMFGFHAVPPGIYLVTASARGWSPSERSNVVVGADEVTPGLELRLGRAGIRLAGRVLDAGGGTIAGATLRALALGPGGRPESARTFLGETAADGTFDMLLLRGSYRVVADADGYVPEIFRLMLDVPRTHDFRLAPGAHVSGRVVDFTGASVPRAEVTLEPEAMIMQPSRLAAVRTVRAGDDGGFTFSGIAPGTYGVVARAGSSIGRAARRVVVTAANPATDVVIEVSRGAELSGTVADDAGRPIPGARVRAGTSLAVLARRDGSFDIEGLGQGRHIVSAEASGHGASQVAVSIDGHSHVQGVRFVLGPEAAVEGRVFDRSGQPLAGASVTALVVTPDALVDAVTSSGVARSDAAGHFEIAGLGAGELRLEAEQAIHGRAVGGPFPLRAGERRKVDLRMGQGGLVRGTVSWGGGAAATNVVVRGSQRGGATSSTVTDAAGRYEVGPFSPGEVSVQARPETDPLEHGANESDKRVALAPGEDKDGVDLELKRRDEEISGVVLDPGGAPVPGAVVGIARPYKGVSYRPYNKYAGEADGADYTVVTDGAGAFTVKFLPRGTFDVWTTHPEFVEADAYGVAAGNHAVRMQLTRGASFAGIAVSGAGKPVTAFRVTAILSQRNAQPAPLRAARGYVQGVSEIEDPNGGFELTGLHPAFYDILVTTADGRGGRLSDIDLAAGEAKRGLEIVVAAGVKVIGRVVDEATQEPVSGINVIASQAMFVSEVQGKSGAGGRFELEGVVPGGTVGLALRGDGRRYGMKRLILDVPSAKSILDAGVIGLPSASRAPQ
jgi:RNA polymerase sigma factor (sigma-70 family)